jgi:hypothetical protein
MDNREYAVEPATALVRSLDASPDEWLDRALEDTFPASDPIASNQYT